MARIEWRSSFWIYVALSAVVWIALSGEGRAQQGAARSATASQANQGQAVRGKYIVESVAMCGNCHTPRDNQGRLERNHWLQGASLWILPARPTTNWPLKAPRIGGNPPATDEEMVTLLTTGIWKDGTRLRAPMPQFRMSKDDAQSVVTYLKSLTPAPTE